MSEQMQNFRLHQLQHDVAAAALSGVACTEIDERVIGQSQGSEEEKTALRLFACSFYSRFELRRMALDRLRDLSGSSPSEAAQQLPLTARLFAETGGGQASPANGAA